MDKGNTKEYLEVILGTIKHAFGDRPSDPEVTDALWNTVHNLDGPRSKQNVKISDKEKFIYQKLFKGLDEITSSYYRMKDITYYFSHFPYVGEKDVSHPNYLRYHIENYLNEMYILKLRITDYIKVITRSYKKSSNYGDMQSALDGIKKAIVDCMDGLITTRGSHVHQSRFTNDDIDRLTTLDLLGLNDGHVGKECDVLKQDGCKDLEATWVNIMDINKGVLDDMLDKLFQILLEHITHDGEIFFPDHTVWT